MIPLRVKDAVRVHNKELTEKYPFLIPRHLWTDKVFDDYDYEYTVLDEMPTGWRDAFGEEMVEELYQILSKVDGAVEAYRIYQIKEKFGFLHWYDNGVPKEVEREYWDWQRKWEDVSEKTCLICGKPGKMCNMSWVMPLCRECYETKVRRNPNVSYEAVTERN